MGSISSHLKKIVYTWQGYDSSKFIGLYDEDIFVAYKTYFHKLLVPYKPQSFVLCGGIENLYTNVEKDVIFVGPKAIEVLYVRKSKRNNRKKKYIAIVHPVIKSQEFQKLTKSKNVKQIFLQVLVPGHTCVLLIQDGIARLIDNRIETFALNPDIISRISAVIPWNIVLPRNSKKVLHLYTLSFNPPIRRYCALAVMVVIKYFINDMDWEGRSGELGIVPVIRNKSLKTLDYTRVNDVRVHMYYCNIIMDCFFELIEANVIKKYHFA